MEELQVEVHTPPAQILVATLVVAQARVQRPQWATVVSRLVSQPSSAAGAMGLLQLPQPERHDEVHTFEAHAAAATLVLAQARPQAPQLEISCVVSTHNMLQQAIAPGQVEPAPGSQPSTQVPPGLQRLPMGQSPGPRHSTQRCCARSQRGDCAGQSLVFLQPGAQLVSLAQ